MSRTVTCQNSWRNGLDGTEWDKVMRFVLTEVTILLFLDDGTVLGNTLIALVKLIGCHLTRAKRSFNRLAQQSTQSGNAVIILLEVAP